ncbi:hypothetical protein MAR_006341 [Mya arenaria]|uniref:Uncharacterized protein n=1 Tax=Mya arenaria TaxID=6604 RepID=A0ABY7DAX8_MYAAR|nr:hypothetical protein MAR_006341 [Mya arenaria]
MKRGSHKCKVKQTELIYTTDKCENANGDQYCFNYKSCAGEKLPGYEGAETAFGTCCLAGGGSWGRHNHRVKQPESEDRGR